MGRDETWLRRPEWSVGQSGLVSWLRRCPTPGVERPTRPTYLAYAERGSPVAVWRCPVTLSQERVNPAAGTGGLKKQRPACRKAWGIHNPPDSADGRIPKGSGREPGNLPKGRCEGTATRRKRSMQPAANVTWDCTKIRAKAAIASAQGLSVGCSYSSVLTSSTACSRSWRDGSQYRRVVSKLS
jgi:hypothetical protein